MSAEERHVTSGRKNFDLFIRSPPGGSGYSESRYDPQVGGQTTLKSFVCPPVRDPASPPQHPAIPTIAGLAARRTDSFRVRSGICRADQTVGNRDGDTGHCFGGTEARNRFAPYSKGNSPIRGKADLKIFVCPPMNGTSPLEERISIYLFGCSRVGAAIPKVATIRKSAGKQL